MTRRADALRYLFPGWFAIVMGLSGLALAWHRASPWLGDGAEAAALVFAALAAAAFVALAAATVLRLRRYPEAWLEDSRHPVRHAFVAAMPVSVILLATLVVALFGPSPFARALWWFGSVAQLAVTLWVLSRWWKPREAGGLVWASATPALLIPIVGNVLVPMAGVPLAHLSWSAAQFGVGLMFWPVVLVLIVVRLAQQGPWPERLMPAAFILVAPPAVVALAALQFGAPVLVGWMGWGMAAVCLLWAASLLGRIAALPFGLPHWGLSFPLAAFTALTLRLAHEGSAPAPVATVGTMGTLAVLALLLLAATSLLIAALVLATWRGLRDGSLLAPEPVATLQNAPTPPSAP